MADIVWRLGLDGSGYERGLSRARRQAMSWEAEISRGWDKVGKKAAGVFGGMFLLHSAQQIGRELLEHVDAVQDLARKYGITTDEAQMLLALSKQTGESLDEMVNGAEGLAGALERAKGASVSLISPEEIEDIRELNRLRKVGWQKSLAGLGRVASGTMRDITSIPAKFREGFLPGMDHLGRVISGNAFGARPLSRLFVRDQSRAPEESRPEDRKDPEQDRKAKRDAEEVKRIYERLTDIQRRTSMMGLTDLQKLADVQKELRQARLEASRDFGLDGKSPVEQANQDLRVGELTQEEKDLQQRIKNQRQKFEEPAVVDSLARIGGHVQGGDTPAREQTHLLRNIVVNTKQTAENTTRNGARLGGPF